MQIKQDKYNYTQSSKVKVLGKGSDVRLDMQLNLNNIETNIGSSITGTVVDSNNKPIQGAIIKLMDINLQPLSNAMTDINGNYIINSVPSSNMYNIIATAQGRLLSQGSPFNLSIGQTKIIDFILQVDPNSNLGAISGSIYDVNSNNISGAIILLYNIVNGSNNLLSITYTDSSGVFCFGELVAGNYSVTINALGYIKSQASIVVKEGIISNMSKILYMDPKSPDGIISGIISDSSNNVIPNADVILYNMQSNNSLTPIAFTTTNSFGIYTFINVPPGNYLIKSNQSQIITTSSPTLPTSITSTTIPISTLPTSITSTTTPISSIGLISNEFTFIGLNNLKINTLKFDIASKKLLVKSTGTPANVNLSTSFYFGVSLYDASNNLKSSVFVLGKDTGDTFASLLNGLSFDYGYYLKVYHYEPSKLTLSGSVYGAPSDLSTGFGTLSLNSIKFYIQPDGLQFTMVSDTNAYTVNSQVVTTVNSNIGNFFNTVSTLNSTFVGAIGDASGYVIVPISVPTAGTYNLSIQYISGDADRLLQVDVNGTNTGSPYIATKTNDWTASSANKINTIISLNAGVNNIKFFNTPNTPGPWIGNLTITMATLNYVINATNGVLTNTSTLLNNTFVGYIGDTGGYVTLAVDIKIAGSYNIAIQYISGDTNRNFRMAINGMDTGLLYIANKTADWTASSAQTLNTFVNLNVGTNTIKLYNNINSPGPWIGTLTISTPPSTTYKISSAAVNNGTSIDSSGYLINIGGSSSGFSIFNVNAPVSGVYSLNVNYRNSNVEKPLNIDINGANIGTSFTVPVATNGVLTTTIILSAGNNRIKFYGEKIINYTGASAPDLLSFSITNNQVISPNIPTTFSADFPIKQAQLFNGATVATDNYVVSQGGPSKGYSILTVSIPYYGRYNLILTRRNLEVRPLNIDVNGINTGTTYYITPGTDKKFIIYDVIFNIGINTIKFYGDNSTNYTPDLLTATVLFVSSSIPNLQFNYDISSTLLINGSFIDNLGYSASNGGPNNGYTLFNVKILNSGIYKLSISYRHHQTSRPLKIDINSINTGTIYNIPYGDPGIFTTNINLTLGINTLKFYGDGSSNYTPDLKNLTLTLITPVPLTKDKYLVPNASTLPNIYQLRNIDMKYGMFIHFGINTFVDQEWTDGSIAPSYYAPTSFEIEKWVELAWESGMNYIISITKHHDGFSVRDSVYSDYDAASSNNSFNVTKAIATACKKYGIKLGLYYSLWDRNWDSRYDGKNNEAYVDYMINQLTELFSGDYGDIVELWLDGGWEKSPSAWQLYRIYDTVKRLQPSCQIATNWTININPTNAKDGDTIYYFPSDFRLADPKLPNANYDPKLYNHENELYYLPFEATVCLKSTWFYNTANDFEGPRHNAQDIQTMYTQLINQNNNFVLNAGPNKEGKQLENDLETLYAAANLLGIARGKALTADIFGNNLALNCSITGSEEPYGATYSCSKVVDGDYTTRWATNDGTDTKWIQLNFGKSISFNRVIIYEATYQGMGMRINSYSLAYWNGTSYVTIKQGTTVGDTLNISFNTITSNIIRFSCASANKGPTISEIEVFNVKKGQTLLPQTVRIEYRNENGCPVQPTDMLYGNLGDSYTTQAKDLTKFAYSLKQVIGSQTGVFTQQETVVTYIYKDLISTQYYSTNYNVATANLSNGANLQLNNTFVGAIGDAGGCVTLTVTPVTTGTYYADIKYLCGDKNRPIKLAINGTPTGVTYTANQTASWNASDVGTLRVSISLNAGINTIKLYNDNNQAGPWVSMVRLTLTL